MKLYNNDKIWEIFKDSDFNIVRKFGKIDGKMITNIRQVVPKNIGKSNETTLETQADKEIAALIKKQKEVHGYTETRGYKSQTKISYRPMLAHNYESRNKSIKFPCHVQPKLDGIRMIAVINKDKKVTFYSRTGKLVNGLEHLRNQLNKIPVTNTLVLDGEAYIHNTPFEEICSAFKSDHNNLEYHVFDIIDTDKSFVDRFEHLKKNFVNNLVPTKRCDIPEDIERFHSEFLEDGYEGIMIRNSNSLYQVDTRSIHLQKFKKFKDDEFTIIDIQEAFGEPGTAVIICETVDKKNFTVRPRGTREYRNKLLVDKQLHLGKQLTVRFQNITENGIPRFPVGISIRDYE